MRPRSISATSLDSYEGCPKRFAAEIAIGRINTDSAPGKFGTALHAALDKYIEKLYATGVPAEHDKDLLMDLWTAASNHYLGFGTDYYTEGQEMLENWVATRE